MVHHQREQRHHGVERDAPDVRPLHAHHKIRGQAQQAAEIVVDQPHVHPLGSLAAQNFLDAVPHISVADDEELQKNRLLGLFEIGQQLRVHGLAAGEILRAGVLPGRVGAVFRHIAALAQPAGVQRVGRAGLLGKVLFVGVVHGLHLQAQAAGGPLVAKGQVQRPAQQRQDADQRDPAHLVGAVLVLAHQIQDDEQAQRVEHAVHPHPPGAGGDGEEHPAQPQQLQRHQDHRDGDAVQNAAEKFDERQPVEHAACPPFCIPL